MGRLLARLEMMQYEQIFAEHAIDIPTLKLLSDEVLRP